MAKANAATGTTLYLPEGAVPPAPGEVSPDITYIGPGTPADVEEGGEEPSLGPSSSASTEPQGNSEEPSSPPPPEPARTTGRRSPKARTGASGAHSGVTTSGPATDASEEGTG